MYLYLLKSIYFKVLFLKQPYILYINDAIIYKQSIKYYGTLRRYNLSMP